MPDYNYAKLDNEGKSWHHIKDWVTAASKLGYQFISEAIIEEYEKHPSSVVAKTFGVSRSAIRHRLKMFRVPLKPQGGANYKAKPQDTTHDKDIVRLYTVEKYSVKTTGLLLSLSYWVVYNRLVTLGVPRRGNRGSQKKV